MRIRNVLLTSTALLALGAGPASAGPDGPVVVGGSATVSGAGTSSTVINQNTNRAIINWNTFNIGAGETTTFVQPNSSSVTLNRVTGGLGPSTIYGTLNANGYVFVINRDGVLVGPSGVINTAGFLASTADITNANFMAGRYNFNIAGKPNASIINQGNITATSGGFAALVAPGVRNTGTITATLGTVALSSGNTFTLDLYGDKLIQLSPTDQIASQVIDISTGKPLTSLVTNDGKLSANGGRVELTASAARAVVDSVINSTGVIEANSVGTRNGMIVLGAATADSKGVGAPTQTVKVSGTISAAGKQKGTKGGSVVVTGEAVQVTGAKIDVSGNAGGGKVMLGGDWGGGNPNKGLVNNQSAALESYKIGNATTLSVDAATTIDASAKGSGNGGKVVLWSETQTTFAGTILARGGDSAGNGGFVEVSSKGGLSFAGSVDTRAPNGLAGTLLLDPEDIVVGTDGTMTVAALESALAKGNVVLSTGAGNGYGNITVANSVSWSSGNSLTLNAYRDIAINGNLTNTGGAAVTLRADSTGTGVGTVSFGAGIKISTAGAVSIYYNPVAYMTCVCGNKYEHANDYTSNVTGGGTLTAYMLVNTFADLQLIGANTNTLGGTYALSKDINADNMAPIGSAGSPFTGLLDGQGYTIKNGVIAPTAAGVDNIGLFGAIGPTGTVRNLNVSDFLVKANPNVTGPGQFVGVIAGQNAGIISNVNVSNSSVDGGKLDGVIAGGLVGQNGMFGPNNQQIAGSISNSSATGMTVTVGNGCDVDCAGGFNIAGGLVGSNAAGSTITNSHATGTVSGGGVSFVGGLVGQNGILDFGTASITGSYANVAVSISGPYSAAGGLVGSNAPGSIIRDSQAFGSVTSKANDFAFTGGLVGLNSGTITSTTSPVLSSVCAIGASFSCATGNVTGGKSGISGGLVGSNDGTIDKSFATGAVTGGNGGSNNADGNSSVVGGLAGDNRGTIRDSFATGNVGSAIAWLVAGGLVGDNSGRIEGSFATGNVVTGNNGTAGGLVGINIAGNCDGCTNPGTGADSSGTIVNSSASGNVTVGTSGTAGGFVGINQGTITSLGTGLTTFASGNVTGGNSSLLGGFSGTNLGTISLAYATGNVTGDTNVVAGGFVGLNTGRINQTYARGAVTGGNSSFVGGFAGANIGADTATMPGSITQSYAQGPVTGGNEAVAAAFAALNRGTIDQAYAVGLVTAGVGSTTGGLVAANDLDAPGSAGAPKSASVGTVTNSYWDRQTTGQEKSAGGKALDTAVLAGGLPAGFDATIWSHGSYPQLVNLGAQNTTPGSPVLPPLSSVLQSPLLLVNTNPINPPAPPPDLLNIQILNQQAQQQQGPAAPAVASINNPTRLDVGAGRYFYLPPPEETRLVQDEVVIQLPCNTPEQTLNDAMARLQLSVLSSQCLTSINTAIHRLHIDGGQSIANTIRALAGNRIIVAGQANYTYTLGQDLAGDRMQGDAGQYVLQKLKMGDILRRVRATNIPVAVIDSEIDVTHPDLEGTVIDRFDATGVEEKPHSHGTGMAGAIASHRRLLGTAPGARLLAIRAFSTQAASAQSTTFNILKGLDHAVNNGVRIVNMSFAGPRDPTIERALAAAYDRGVVLIAAAGNAGPKSPPLFPAADKHVIAVTATDIDDKLFTGANRGNYIAVAAPGVDILVPAPEGTYQMTTGTSVATAHVSGIVALMLERNPNLTPADVRRILTASAKKLGPNEQFGSGLIDPGPALQLATPRQVEAPETATGTVRRR
jgi:filamentous hemagglutinin family protein